MHEVALPVIAALRTGKLVMNDVIGTYEHAGDSGC